MRTQLFENTSGVGSVVPLAIYRVVFYGACLLHFLPVVLSIEDNFGPYAYRVSNWEKGLFELHSSIEMSWFYVAGGVLVVGALSGMAGRTPRTSAALTGVPAYFLASVNSLNVHTLALGPLWGVLTIWFVAGSGFPRRAPRSSPDLVVEARFTRGLIGYYLLLTVFVAAVEKVWSGWPFSGSMGRLLVYPGESVLRSWVVSASGQPRPFCGFALEVVTLCVELGIPFVCLMYRTRRWIVLLWIAFFGGIGASLSIPPLFLGIYMLVPLLLVDDRELTSLLAARARLASLAT